MKSPAGALGHFQFMPDTAKQYGVNDPNDLQQSATGAARMLSDLQQQTGGDLPKTLAAYNWGIGNLNRKGLDAAPAETRGYIGKVLSGLGNAIAPPAQADEFDRAQAEYLANAPWKQSAQSNAAQPSDDFEKAQAEYLANAPWKQQTAPVAQPVTPQAPQSESKDAFLDRVQNETLAPFKNAAHGLGNMALGIAALGEHGVQKLGVDTDKMRAHIGWRPIDDIITQRQEDWKKESGNTLGANLASLVGEMAFPLGAAAKGAALLKGGKTAQAFTVGGVANAAAGAGTDPNQSVVANFLFGGAAGATLQKLLGWMGKGQPAAAPAGATIADNAADDALKAVPVDVDTAAARAAALQKMMQTNPEIVNKLSPGQITGNRTLQTLDTTLADTPLSGKQALNESLQNVINNDAVKTISNVDDGFQSLSPSNLDAIQDAIQNRYKYVAQQGGIEGTNYLNLLQNLKDLKQQAATGSQKESVDAFIKTIGNHVNPDNALSSTPKMTGDEYQNIRNAVKGLYDNKDVDKATLKQGLGILDGAFKQRRHLTKEC